MFNIWTISSFASGNGLSNDLVSYYKMDTNWSFPDSHWGNNWTINGATFTASWKINWWYNFDWVNDEVTISAFSTISKSQAFTVSIWFKADTTSWTRTLWNQNLWGSDRVWAQIMSNELRVAIFNWTSYFVINNVAFSDTASFHHLLVTFDGSSTLTSYLDNTSFTTWSNTPSLNASTSQFDFWIKQDNSWDYDWTLDESGVWDVVITTDQRDTLYNSWSWLSFDEFTN